MSLTDHWQRVYQTKRTDEVSWYRPHLDTSLSLVSQSGVARTASVIDVGAGASSFVDDLLERGFDDLTVLDISQSALDLAKERLGPRAADVNWVAADVTSVVLAPHRFQLWHDRAVFHFLTSSEDRARYVAQARRAVARGGFLIVATFGPEGPQKCSGLPTARYSAPDLQALFAPDFVPVDSLEECHRTPSGGEQQFVYCL